MLIEKLFEEVLRLSFYGSIGCGVILICVLVNYTRTPRWISMVLWGLVALRLVVPLSVSSSISLLQLGNTGFPSQLERALSADHTYSGNYKTALEGSHEYDRAVAAGSPIAANANGNKMTYYYERANGGIEPAKTSYERFLTAGSRIWLAGMILLWLWALLSCLRLKYRLRFSMRLCRGIYETDAIPSPCVTGILRPRIYLIPALTEQQKAHILLHEKMHIRYLDPVWKMVSFVIISIHWFNPFLWFMYKIFQGELEKACDERVLARLGEDKKADYSESLLALAASKSWRQKNNFPTPISFGENNIKGRIKRILAYQKPLAAVSVLIVLLSAVGCGVFLTTPAVSSADTPKTNPPVSDDANPHTDDTVPTASSTDHLLTAPAATATDTTALPENTAAGIQTDVLENNEIYDELEYNGVTYQSGDNGIFRKAENASAAEQIYAVFAGTNIQMTIFEEKLYFKTDRTYTEGALDWADNTIRWIDLDSLQTGDLPMVRENALISDFWLYDGMIKIYYSYPDAVDTMMLYTDKDVVFNQKNITQLTEAEQQQFGLGVTQSVLQNTGSLVNLSNRLRGQNIAYLDMDGDGTAEKVTLSPSTSPEALEYYREDDPLAYYHLQIGSAALEGFGYNVANILWGLSLDGQTILLALYEDGPSADPYTHFYQYQNGQLTEIGGFDADIRRCDISSDGIIISSILKEIVQTDWITVRWQLGPNGLLEEIPQDVYDFTSRNWVQLYDALPLHTAVGADDTFTIDPQSVRFLQTSADWNWILLETKDGQQGWVHLENFEVVELQKNVMDVFDGLYMAG
ncbi:MAG: M56 family metallopeptidase [Lachnospiraceae bacterium]